MPAHDHLPFVELLRRYRRTRALIHEQLGKVSAPVAKGHGETAISRPRSGTR